MFIKGTQTKITYFLYYLLYNKASIAEYQSNLWYLPLTYHKDSIAVQVHRCDMTSMVLF